MTTDDDLSTFFPGTMPAPSEWSEVPRYAVTFLDPLIADELRTEAQQSMQRLCSRWPRWAALWYAGVASTTVLTLPATDPWRNKHPLVTTPLVHQARSVPRQRFGTVDDAVDLTACLSEDLAGDIGLAAFAEPLNDDAAHVLAAAAGGWRTAALVLASRVAPETDLIFSTGHAVLRWAFARRRQYTGHEDTATQDVMLNWGWIASRIAHGRPHMPEKLDELIAAFGLPEDAYFPVTDF